MFLFAGKTSLVPALVQFRCRPVVCLEYRDLGHVGTLSERRNEYAVALGASSWSELRRMLRFDPLLATAVLVHDDLQVIMRLLPTDADRKTLAHNMTHRYVVCARCGDYMNILSTDPITC